MAVEVPPGPTAPDAETAPETVAPGALSALLAELVRTPEDAPAAVEPTPGNIVGRFELVRRLGAGGFGAVWEAKDRQLGRRVAVKLIRPGQRSELREESLLREAEAAARLSHDNIVALHDVGRSEYGPYLVLELLRGTTLAVRLSAGPLPLHDAVRIVRDVARGVAHAHAGGVVHRDLKPANVFLCDDGRVKVLDFGLAHAFGRRRQSGGTPAYMAPEQWKDAPEDERTDVFALGVILHQALSGTLPFADEKEAVGRWPAPALEIEAAPELGPLVARMLAKDPLERPRDAGEVLAALDACLAQLEKTGSVSSSVRTRRHPRWRLAAVIAVGIVLGIAIALGVTSARRGPAGAEGRLLVAVADFVNETHDPDLDSLSGLLITSLEQSNKLRVLTRGRLLDLMRQVGKGDASRIDEALARDVGRKAGVRALLLASIRRLDQTYVVELRALDPQEDEYLFALREQATSRRDLLGLVDRLSEGIRIRLQEDRREVRALEISTADAVTPSLEAYRHYFLGKDLAARGSFLAAIPEFRRALEVEPRFALAQYELAFSGLYAFTPDRELIHEAVRSATRAPAKEAGLIRALDHFIAGRLAAARAEVQALAARYPEDRDVALLAAETLAYGGDLQAAALQYERALQLAPDLDFIRAEYVMFLQYLGRSDEARMIADAAARERPSPSARWVAAVGRIVSGDLEGGTEALQLAGSDDNFSGMFLAQALGAQGKLQAALDSLSRSRGLLPDAGRAVALAYSGRLREGSALLASAARQPGVHFGMGNQYSAWYLTAAGDLEGARRVPHQGAWITIQDVMMLGETGGVRARALLAELPPESLFAHLLHALLSRNAGDIGSALAELRALDRHAGAFVPYYHGLVAAEAGLDEEAVEALRRFVDGPVLMGADGLLHPWFVARGRYLMALSLDRLGRADEARPVIEAQVARWKSADHDLPLLSQMKALCRKLACRGP